MKNIKLLLVFSALCLALATPALADRDDDGPGHGRMGEHGGWGGHMGGGMGHMMMGDMEKMPSFSKLSPEKQDGLRKLHKEHEAAVKKLMADAKTHMDEVHTALHKFPLDRKSAETHHEAAHKIKDTMFPLMLDHMEKVQKLLGKEDFEKMAKDMDHMKKYRWHK